MNKQQKVVIFGAGIAGLSTAHYLLENSKENIKITIVESLSVPGGLARSERVSSHNGMPSEYSWRGFGPWYHNTFDVMKKIPTKNGSVFSTELSHPINFLIVGVSPEKDKNKFRITTLDKLKIMLMFIRFSSASRERSINEYSKINASDYIKQHLSKSGSHAISWVFGPWIGSDASRVSVHQATEFFQKNYRPGLPAPYFHESPVYGRPDFSHGNESNWLILKRPSNESWFDPWVSYLQEKGVTFMFNTKLEKLETSSDKITSALLSDGSTISCDYYILATNPYSAEGILDKTPDLLKDSQLSLFSGLTADEPHKQISFRIAFSEKINFGLSKPNEEIAVILVDSEFDITLFSQDNLFHEEVYLGRGELGSAATGDIKSLWSGTATIDSNPGKIYNLPFSKLTKEQFIEEIKYQIFRSQGLNELIKKANCGRELNSFEPIAIEVWHTWQFPKDNCSGIVQDPDQPKWVNNTNNQKFLPSSKTDISNLFLAGAHTKTNADLYSMEAAVESGRRVADLITNKNTVIPQVSPSILTPFRAMDSVLYSAGLPNVIDVITVLLTVLILIIVLFYLSK